MIKKTKSILFVGQAFYNAWYLSRELKKIGWETSLINIDNSPNFKNYYHGEDILFLYNESDRKFRLNTLLDSIYRYRIFHFSNKDGIYFMNDSRVGRPGKIISKIITLVIQIFFKKKSPQEIRKRLLFLRLIKKGFGDRLEVTGLGFLVYKLLLCKWFTANWGSKWDIQLIKNAGIKIGYSNNGCLDGVLKTSFSKWGPINTCKEVCRFYNQPNICSDEGNAEWGRFRNSIADYQCNIGSNKVDYNNVPEVFEMPWFYCLDRKVWSPDVLIPSNFLLPFSKDTVKIYHAVGNFESRSDALNKNIKCTHIYLELIEKYKNEGLPVELIFFHGLPNKVIRFYQAQADIVVDMLTFGFFGANIREAMMLGKPTVCYLRPEWLETMREEIPDYVDELPIVSATPQTVDEILRELINNKEKREEIGRRSRIFAEKWHSSEIAAKYFDLFLTMVIDGDVNKAKVFEIQKEIYK